MRKVLIVAWVLIFLLGLWYIFKITKSGSPKPEEVEPEPKPEHEPMSEGTAVEKKSPVIHTSSEEQPKISIPETVQHGTRGTNSKTLTKTTKQ